MIHRTRAAAGGRVGAPDAAARVGAEESGDVGDGPVRIEDASFGDRCGVRSPDHDSMISPRQNCGRKTAGKWPSRRTKQVYHILRE